MVLKSSVAASMNLHLTSGGVTMPITYQIAIALHSKPLHHKRVTMTRVLPRLAVSGTYRRGWVTTLPVVTLCPPFDRRVPCAYPLHAYLEPERCAKQASRDVLPRDCHTLWRPLGPFKTRRSKTLHDKVWESNPGAS